MSNTAPISAFKRILYLLRHVLEGVGKALLAEGQLANGPDLGVLFSMHERCSHTDAGINLPA